MNRPLTPLWRQGLPRFSVFFAQDVADASNRVYEPLKIVRFSFLSQIADIDFYDVAFSPKVISPYAIVDDIPR